MIFQDQGAKFLKNRQFQGRLKQLHLNKTQVMIKVKNKIYSKIKGFYQCLNISKFEFLLNSTTYSTFEFP